MAVDDNIEFFDDPPEEKNKWSLEYQITRVPCLRDALITGIVGGMITGMGVFSYKMHVMKACKFAVGGFGVITLVSLFTCQHARKVEHERVQQAKDMLTTYAKQKREERKRNDEN